MGPDETLWTRGSTRFDHPLDPPMAQDRGILYAATGDDAIATCLAEVFQDTRLVDTRRNEPWLAAFTLMEDVSLLDLSGKWPTKAKASANFNSGPRPRCRRWSRTIYDAYPDLIGLYYASSMNGNEPAVVLYERASKRSRACHSLIDRSPTHRCSSPSRGSPPSSATI